jgi:hypothetical protein
MQRGIAAAVLGAVLALAAPARAETLVYSPVVHEGEKEVGYYVEWREDSTATDVVDHELEFEWGAGARDQVSAYAIWSDLSGRDLEMTGYRLEWIHQFFEQGERAWDLGSYLEYVMTDTGDAAGVEAKVLAEKTLPRTTLTLNGVLSKAAVAWKEESVEVAYAARWALRLGPRVTPAVELYGDLGQVEDLKDWPETTQLVGPVVDLRLTRFVRWQVGALFGFTKDTENVRVKTQLAVEWY